MYRRRKNVRGLAEIVGTLMLVLIVVAAAVAFSLFVASYQTQVQNEQRASHDRSLEAIHIISITTIANGSSSVIHLVSGDVNWMNLTGYVVNGIEVTQWDFQAAGGAAVSCSWPSTQANCTELAPLSAATLTLIYNLSQTLSPSKAIRLSVFTKLANQFNFEFFPPVAIIKVSELPDGSSKFDPLFDGSASYEPMGGDNATIIEWNWTIHGGLPVTTYTYYGPEVEVDPLNSSVIGTYNVSLQVTNSDGLTSSALVTYTT